MRPAAEMSYLEGVRARSKRNRISENFQFVGISIAEMLNDVLHKGFYIKLAKNYDFQTLLALAKDISRKPGVKNKGAYFTKMVQELKREKRLKPNKNSAVPKRKAGKKSKKTS